LDRYNADIQKWGLQLLAAVDKLAGLESALNTAENAFAAA